MDSLTQIVLGAAVSEVSVGKKIGNRSIVWGGIAGTIPDLDIVSNLWMDPLDALSFHRGISHSFLFAFIAAPLLGYLVHALYQSKYHHIIAFVGWCLLFAGIEVPILLSGTSIIVKLLTMVMLGIIIWSVYKRYFIKEQRPTEASVKDWIILFFLAIVTHPILDSFTTYGTQLFQPFSDYRVSFCNISVADPMYTIPLIISLVLMSRYAKERSLRRILVWIGLGVSSLYMIFTLVNKSHINHVFENSLIENNIEYQRYMTSPTILNNVLWFCLAEREEEYIYGFYSIFDKSDKVELNRIPKNYHLLKANEDDRVIKILNWFSNGYYTVTDRKDGVLQINDMRFGMFENVAGKEDFIFRFGIQKANDGSYRLVDEQAGPPTKERKKVFKQMWTRIKGV